MNQDSIPKDIAGPSCEPSQEPDTNFVEDARAVVNSLGPGGNIFALSRGRDQDATDNGFTVGHSSNNNGGADDCHVFQQMAMSIIDDFSHQSEILEKATETLRLEDKPQVTKSRKPSTSSVRKPRLKSAARDGQRPIASRRPSPTLQLKTQTTRTIRQSKLPLRSEEKIAALEEKLTKAAVMPITTGESSSAPSQASQKSESPLPTVQTSDTGSVDAGKVYNGLADALYPVSQVLKKYYRQSDRGGPAQPIRSDQAPISVGFRSIVGEAAS